MKKMKVKLAIATATGAVLMLSGVTAVNASDLNLAAQQPSVISEINGDSDGMYIVLLADPPVATYEGGISGYEATSAKSKGKKRLDTNSKAARKYEKFLRDQQKELLGNAGKAFGRGLDTQFDYQHAINGFALELTVEEAKAMRSMNGVVSVQRERMEQLLTDAGPAFIGAPEVWKNPPNSTMGEGVTVAILDTGINFDHPSFAAVSPADGYVHTNPLGSGNWVPGSYCDTVDPGFCNDKLIGAWTFVAEPVTPNDSDGHGSHTAGTVAGNFVDGATLYAPTTSASFDISGVAPRANIIAYDVCIDSCPGAALVAAVNQVIIDNANVPGGIQALNYSISGGGNPYNDAVELGFLAATAAGVYVSASAGNAGPGPSTVAHLGPWVSTTAASTHNRAIVNALIDLNSSGGGTPDISGLGFTSGYGPAPIINSADLEGAFPGSTLCGLGGLGSFIPPWPPGTFNGEIVACTRGTFGRVEKGANVLAAGAGGYVLMDNGGGVVGDAHVLPGVHISLADRGTLEAWLAANAANNPMASIEGYSLNFDAANGDVMAGFSSRGPQQVFDVNKPDLTAPGVSIFAAEADGQAPAPEYQFLGGTSMSSPHNAGSGALLAAATDWNPYEIKSALMMTATTEFTVKEDGVTPTDPFDLGAGRIQLGGAKDAGLVLDETPANFLAANPSLGGDPSTLNVASMMDSACVGTCSWTRTVTNPDNSTSHWDVTASGPAGVGLTVEVSPEANSDDYNLKLKKGESATITVTADTTLANPGWNFGTLDLDRNLDKGPDLHMPIAVFATDASNPDVFTKTVDKSTAAPGEILTYELTVTNGTMAGLINMTDPVPPGTTYVPGSATESVVGGTTFSPWAESGGVLTWAGELDLSDMAVIASGAPFGYFSLASLGVSPLGFPGNCDDGAWGLGMPAIDFNGVTYSSAIMSVNGTLEVGTASGIAASFSNQNLPDPVTPNNILAPFWRDLNGCPGDGSQGNLYAATLSAGPFQWFVVEWEDIPFFGLPPRSTFQIWMGTNASAGGNTIHYTYARLDDPNASYTAGAENASGTLGDSYYYNGAGTPVAVGVDLEVVSVAGGSATLGFQVVTDCSEDPTVNTGEVENAGNTETAIAVTTCP
jgi:uncharacterized repeat protein (TIGR01451 family)